jgi:hypothetical protein
VNNRQAGAHAPSVFFHSIFFFNYHFDVFRHCGIIALFPSSAESSGLSDKLPRIAAV